MRPCFCDAVHGCLANVSFGSSLFIRYRHRHGLACGRVFVMRYMDAWQMFPLAHPFRNSFHIIPSSCNNLFSSAVCFSGGRLLPVFLHIKRRALSNSLHIIYHLIQKRMIAKNITVQKCSFYRAKARLICLGPHVPSPWISPQHPLRHINSARLHVIIT